MKVILKESVPNLGTVGDIVTVKPGYGRNYLVPRGLAIAANANNINEIEHHKRALETKRRRALDQAGDLAKELGGMVLTFARKTSDQDHLFGSVTSADIEAAIREKGYEAVTRKQIVVEQPIKSLGEFDVTVRLHGSITAEIKVVVEKEEEVD